jgi:hypothetical protein
VDYFDAWQAGVIPVGYVKGSPGQAILTDENTVEMVVDWLLSFAKESA